MPPDREALPDHSARAAVEEALNLNRMYKAVKAFPVISEVPDMATASRADVIAGYGRVKANKNLNAMCEQGEKDLCAEFTRTINALCDLLGGLRAEVTHLKEEQVSLVGSLGDAQAEMERLKERYDAVRHAYAVEAQERGRLEAEVERVAQIGLNVAAGLRDENERLRKALRSIEKPVKFRGGLDIETWMELAQSTAELALGSDEDGAS